MRCLSAALATVAVAAGFAAFASSARATPTRPASAVVIRAGYTCSYASGRVLGFAIRLENTGDRGGAGVVQASWLVDGRAAGHASGRFEVPARGVRRLELRIPVPPRYRARRPRLVPASCAIALRDIVVRKS